MFRDILKELRKKKGLTQEQLASILGVERSSVGKYESSSTIPSVDVLNRIADYFNVSIDYLLGRETPPESDNPLDTELKSIMFALYGNNDDLSDEAKKDIIDFYNFKKAQEKKKGK